MEYNYDTGEYEASEETCHTCGTLIYDSDPSSCDREDNPICEKCASALAPVYYMKYHSDGVHFDVLAASIPLEEVVTLQLETFPKCVVVGVQFPAYISTRRYDATNLPDFVELYEGTYRYVPGKRIKF